MLGSINTARAGASRPRDRKGNKVKILKKDIMPDGTKIQLEDWSEDYSCFDTLHIAAYPILKRVPQSRKFYWAMPGDRFRVEIVRGFNNDQEVLTAFEELKTGKKSIIDFSNQFWDFWHVECL